MVLPEKLVFVDIETTGSRVTYDRIIEIGILRVENNQLVDTYQTLINPEVYLSPFIENMTGIRNEKLEQSPTFSEVKSEILDRLSDCVFVAHNVRFDYGFLKNEFKRYDTTYTSKHFCTAKLSKQLFPKFKRHNLDALISRFGFTCQTRHRAFDDAQVLWHFYQTLLQTIDAKVLHNAVDLALKKPSLPTVLSADVFDNLPESPGVYIFYGENDMPLYIGKSINIKERVLSHFSNDYESSREMSICSQTTRIETMVTAGELGALFKESSLIKSMQPLYNRRLRLTQSIVLLTQEITQEGYQSVKIQETKSIMADMLDQILGIFRSKRQAKQHLELLVKNYQLCNKFMSLEKTNSSCFSHKLGICNGACLGKEASIRYNMRFVQAFHRNKIQPWPYKGPILIKETNPQENIGEGFVVDKWCLLGSLSYEYNNPSDVLSREPQFDYDTYMILNRALRSEKLKHSISLLN